MATMSDYFIFYSDLHLHEYKHQGMFEQGISVHRAIGNAAKSLRKKGGSVTTFFLGDMAEGVRVRGTRAYTSNVISAAWETLPEDLYIVPGNHDTNMITGRTWLEVLATPKIVSSPCVWNFGDMGIFVVPYMKEAELKDLLRNDATPNGSDFRSKYKHRIMVGHFGVIGADTGHGADWIGEVSVDDIPIDRLGLDHVILGHYHMPQDVTDKIHYCGSPMPLKAGDDDLPSGMKRGIIILEVDGDNMRLIRAPINVPSLVAKSNIDVGSTSDKPVDDTVDRAEQLGTAKSKQAMLLEYISSSSDEAADDLTTAIVEAVFEGVNSSEKWDKEGE